MSVLSQFFGGSDEIPIEVFAVGGGGGGGWAPGLGSPGAGGGGGAGQVVYARTNAKFGVTYPILIGGGGASNANGSETVLTGIVFSGGGNRANSSAGITSSFGSIGGIPGSLGVTNGPNMSFSFSNNSFGYTGQNNGGDAINGGGGGGGGAFSKGFPATNPTSPAGGDGGNGLPASHIGIPTAFFGGGGGGSGSGSNGSGGIGGGSPSGPPRAGTVNTGGGGGGAPSPGASAAGTGGSGTLIIRYPTGYSVATAIGTTTDITPQPGYYVYRWNTGPGSITFNR